MVCIKHRRLSYSRCCRSRGLNPLVKALPVPFPWDAYTAVAVVRGACTSRVSSVPTRQTLTRCHCFSARNLDPFPPESVLAIPRVAFGTAAALRCTRHPVAKVVGTDAAGRSFLFTTCRHFSARNRNRLPVASSVSTARDAYAVAAGACGPAPPSGLVCSDPRGAHLRNLPLHECAEPVPNSAGIVCDDSSGRLCSRCLSAFHQYLLPRVSSVSAPFDAHSVLAACSCLSMRGLYHVSHSSFITTPRDAQATAAGERVRLHYCVKVVSNAPRDANFGSQPVDTLVGRA